MQVHFSGHTTAPSPEKVSISEIQSIMPDEDRGCFDYTWEASLQDEILTVSFLTRILISEELNNTEAAEVVAHERRHFEDFRRLVRELKEDIEEAIEAGKDPEIRSRLEWFDYDNCVARQQSHSLEGIVDNLPCIEPLSSSPKSY